MKKSISSREYKILVELLAKFREQAGFTQTKLAEAIEETQSTVSKIERGERRIDMLELFVICKAMGVSPIDFVKAYEEAISEGQE